VLSSRFSWLRLRLRLRQAEDAPPKSLCRLTRPSPQRTLTIHATTFTRAPQYEQNQPDASRTAGTKTT
jgi:hypothetical protein